MFKAAIFDWDGTLCDNVDVFYEKVCARFEYHGVHPPSLDAFRKQVGSNFMVFYRANGIPPITQDELSALSNIQTKERWREASLNGQIGNLLGVCKKFHLKTAIVSGAPRGDLLETVRKRHLSPFVDFIYGNARDKKIGLEETLNFLEVRAEDAFYVDDTFDGIAVTRELGMIPIGFTGGFNTESRIVEAQPDFVIDSLKSVEAIVRAGGGKIPIGLVAKPGAGKETFIRFLKLMTDPERIGHHQSGSIIRKTLEDWTIPVSRENTQRLPVVIENSFGKGRLSQVMKKKILYDLRRIPVFDGMRFLTDLTMFKALSGGILVYITAPQEKRFEWLRDRKEKVGEEEMTWEQFLIIDEAETERYVPEIGAHADFTIENNGTFDEFRKKVEEFFGERVQPLL